MATPPRLSPSSEPQPAEAFRLPPGARELLEQMLQQQQQLMQLLRLMLDSTAPAPSAPTASASPPTAERRHDGLGYDADRPPAPGARLGRDPRGDPAWYVPSPTEPGRYVKLER